MDNKHLNIFRTYTKVEREYQLENDLTRALAISFQEDPLFFHEILKEVLSKNHETNLYKQLFESLGKEVNITIKIQEKTQKIGEYEYDYIFAISVSGEETILKKDEFWAQNNPEEYKPICDLVVYLNNIVLVFEMKRNNTNCTNQLYEQIFNIVKVKDSNIDRLSREKFEDKVFPMDLNWQKLMEITMRISNFEKSVKVSNRFLSDFISLVREHNSNWLPDPPILLLSRQDISLIENRIESAIKEVEKEGINKLNNRLGFEFDKGWTNEINFKIKEGDLAVCIYAGNTKRQGEIFLEKNVKFNDSVKILGDKYEIEKNYHIKFSDSYGRYITGIWLDKSELTGSCEYNDFQKYSGRREKNNLNEIEKLFDNSLNDIDWRKKCKWEQLIKNTNRTIFNISFGYELKILISFEKLQELDKDTSDLKGLTNLLQDIYSELDTNLVLTK